MAARSSTRKLQDYEFQIDGDSVTIPVYYKKPSNGLGVFYMESVYWEHKFLGPCPIASFESTDLKLFEPHCRQCVEKARTNPENLKYIFLTRKTKYKWNGTQALRTEDLPIFREGIWLAKDERGRYWVKHSPQGVPKALSAEEYERDRRHFVEVSPDRLTELTEFMLKKDRELSKLKADWWQDYTTELAELHDGCISEGQVTANTEVSFSELIKKYTA